MKRVIVSLSVVLLLLSSLVPAESILKSVGPIVVSGSSEVDLASIRSRIVGLEKTGFGNELDRVVDDVLALGRFAFLLFYADWCHFCEKEKPIINRLEDEFFNRLVFVRINSTKNPEAMKKFNVNGFPAMFIVYGKNDGKFAYHGFSGFQEEAFLRNVFNTVTSQNPSTLDWELIGYDNLGNSSCFPHHSCSFSKCLKNCVKDAAEGLSLGKIMFELGDFLKSCAGLKAEEALELAYKGAKAGLCGTDCAAAQSQEVATGHGDPRAIGDCVRCVIARSVGSLPVAGCPISIADKLAKLLTPVADCAAECAAPPSTWSKDYGHDCIDKRTPNKFECVSPSAWGSYSCVDCEWYLPEAAITNCPFYKPDCVNTPNGPRCEDKCDKLNCDDGDPCTWDWCSTKTGCQHVRSPGCDKPDDNFGVSNLFAANAQTTYKQSEVGVVSNGFAPSISTILSELGEPPTLIDMSLQGIDDYPVLVIPSGGLSGVDSSPTFRNGLEQYVDNGGTLIVFSQQHGYEYQALPKHELSGYGWLEDISCQLGSSTISTYHSIFSSQHSNMLDVNVDGYFTSYPENSSVLLTRTKNGMPVMVKYRYGRGWVIASTLYSDMSSSMFQDTGDEKALLKDLITWAIDAENMPSFALGVNNISIPITNPYLSPLEYPVQEFKIGDTINLPLNVTNQGNVTIDQVSFALYDPSANKFLVNVSDTIAVNQSKIINMTFKESNASKPGIWSIYYLLSAANSPVYLDYAGEFALNYSIIDHSQLDAFVTILDPDQNIVLDQNASLFILPGRTGSVDLAVNADKYGIWTAIYSVLTKGNRVLISERYHFAIARFKENPEGFVFQDSQTSFQIASDSTQYVYGKNAVFTITARNEGDNAKNVTCKWAFPNPNLHTLTVPAHGEENFTFTSSVYKSGTLMVQFYEGETPMRLLGQTSLAFDVYHPDVDLSLNLDKQWYAEGETASLLINLDNLQPVDYSPQVTVRVLDPNNLKIFENSFSIYYLPKLSSTNKTLTISLSPNSAFGAYTVIAEAYNETEKIASKAIYFEIPKVPLNVRFAKSAFRIRENLGMEVLLSNYLPTTWSQTVSIAVPDLSFSDTQHVEIEAGKSRLLDYNLMIPQELQAGKHPVFINYIEQNVASEFDFFIAEPKLQQSLAKTTYLAGENVSMTLENVGGTDASYTFQATLLDQHLQTIFNETSSDTIKAGQNIIFSFPIPTGAKKGTYYLLRQVENLQKREISSTADTLFVDGSDASLTVETDKKVYSVEEAINVLTDIINLNKPVYNGTLNLQITGTRKCVVPQDNLYITEDTVLCPGVYSLYDSGQDGTIIINANDVTLEGNNTVLVSTPFDRYQIGILNPGYSGVTIKNIEIRDFYVGISLASSRNNLVENTTISSQRRYPEGIFLDQSDSNTIVNNNISNLESGDAIHLNYASYNTIAQNRISNMNSDPVYLYYSHSNTIRSNIISNARTIDLEASNGNNITDNTLDNTFGIQLYSYCSGNIVASNNVSNGKNIGINVYDSDNNIIADNIAESNKYGIYISYSGTNTLTNNTMLNNTSNFNVDGDAMENFVQNVDTTNKVDGKPVYYLVGVSNVVVDATTNAGYVAIVNSANVTVRDLVLANNGQGVLFSNVTNSSIENVTAYAYYRSGIELWFSNYDTLLDLTVSSNNSQGNGIRLTDSAYNNIMNSTIFNHSYAGVTITRGNNNTIMNNNATSNGYGIYLTSSSNNMLIENQLLRGQWGIYLDSASNDNIVRRNNATECNNGFYLRSSSSNMITGNNARSSSALGIGLENSGYNTLLGNDAANGDIGITLSYSANNNLSGNTAQSNKQYGISLMNSGSNTLDNNLMLNNTYNFAAQGASYAVLNNDVDTSNLVDGKPIYYLVDVSNIVLDSSSNAGTVYCINCVKVTIKDLNLTSNWAGICFYNTTDSTIQNNTMSHNWYGVYFSYSSHNNVLQNNASDNNGYGINFDYSNANQVSNNTANSNVNGAGIKLNNSNSSSISDNTADFNYHGISLSYSNSNNVTGNNVAQNRMGIVLFYAATTNNVLLENTACSNEYDILTAYTSTNSGFNNTCTSTQNWNDNGATGCTYKCGGGSTSISCTNCSPKEPALASSLQPPVPPLAIAPNIQSKTFTHGTVDSYAWHQSNINTLVAQSQFQKGRGSVLWEKNITIDLTNIQTDIPTYVGTLNVTGKLYLYATLYSSTGQIIASNVIPFYITDQNLTLTMETDKTAYKPGETVNITGSVENRGSARNGTLTIAADGITIFSMNMSLDANASYPFTTSVSANSSFMLEASFDEAGISNHVAVETPQIDASIAAPDIVGREEFNVTIMIRNTGNVPVNLDVSMGTEEWNITLLGGDISYLQTKRTATENTTLTVLISGDVNQTLYKNVIFGEKTDIQVTPKNVYREGIAGIPYTITNTGMLDTFFNMTFSTNNQTVVKEAFIAAGTNLTDTIHFDLPKGLYVLQYASPFWSNSINIDVESGPEFVIESTPQDMNFNLGEIANITITVKNIGGKEGEARVDLESPGMFSVSSQAWIASMQEANMTFSIAIPDDIEEKNYAMFFKLDGHAYETSFHVLGARIAVNARLDKQLYVEGENATLTLTIQNLKDFNVPLFSRIRLGNYDAVLNFNLTGLETKEQNFSVPIAFDAGKLLYTVYVNTGRALYINSAYAYQKPPDSAGIALYTDKQVYQAGDRASIYVSTTRAGSLFATAPGFMVNTTLSVGMNILAFDIPLLRSGTYSIEYAFDNFTSSYPIDIVGYSARILNSSLDRSDYSKGESLTLTLRVDVNRNFQGRVEASILNRNDNITATAGANHTFTAGENVIQLSTIVNSNLTGLHKTVFKVYAYGSFIFLASGARYFDIATAVPSDTTPPEISYVDATNGIDINRPIIEDEPIAIHAIVSDNVNVAEVALYYRKEDAQSYTKIIMAKCSACIDTYNGTIPASAVTTATIAYYINATDGTNFTTHPATNPTASPHIVSVNLYPVPVVLNAPSKATVSSMMLNWTENADVDFKNYTIFQSNASGAFGLPIYGIADRSTVFYNVTDLSANATYYFTVRVYDSGDLYADSNQVQGKTAETSSPPPPSAEFPWTNLAIGLTAAVVAATIILVIVMKKRKKQGVTKEHQKQ